jgi:hypothetical protein
MQPSLTKTIRKRDKKMKTSVKRMILLSIYFIITACNVPAPTPSSSIKEVVIPTQMKDEEAIRAALAAHLCQMPTSYRRD